MSDSDCQRCGSTRVVLVSGKVSDGCFVSNGLEERMGYVPGDMNIEGGDYLSFEYCLQCGQMQGKFPLEPCALETGGAS